MESHWFLGFLFLPSTIVGIAIQVASRDVVDSLAEREQTEFTKIKRRWIHNLISTLLSAFASAVFGGSFWIAKEAGLVTNESVVASLLAAPAVVAILWLTGCVANSLWLLVCLRACFREPNTATLTDSWQIMKALITAYRSQSALSESELPQWRRERRS